MKRQYAFIAILVAIGVWAFGLTQNIHSVVLWLVGFGVLIAVTIAILLVIYRMKTSRQSDQEASALRKAKESLENREKQDGKK